MSVLMLLLSAFAIVCQCSIQSFGAFASSPPIGEPNGASSTVPPSKIEFEDLPILVPDTEFVDSAKLREVRAEKFLSLWHIFVLSGKVVVSDEPWTLLVPLNEGLSKDRSFLKNKEFTREVLLNHMILGDLVDLDLAITGGPPFYSLADSELFFTREGGSTFVNGIRLTGDKFEGNNSVIFVIENTIPLSQPEYLEFVPLIDKPASSLLQKDLLSTGSGVPLQLDESISDPTPEMTLFPSLESPSTDLPIHSTSRPTRFEKFRNRVTVSSDSPLSVKSVSSTPEALREIPKALISLEEITQIEESSLNAGDPNSEAESVTIFDEFGDSSSAGSNNATFLSSMLDELGTVNSNGAEFVHHFLDADLQQYLSPEKNYTAIIPTNDAFYDYYPIDWGFNPFLVQNFTKDVLLNHILEGDIHLQEFDDAVEIHTIAGRIIKVVKDKAGTVLVNGHVMPMETEIEMANGRLYFLHELMFVDYERVNNLREEYPFLETAPLLSFPWPSSPFLSHLLKRLQENPNTKLFAHLLRNSDIAHLVVSSDENMNRLTYSAFVPTDESLRRSFRVENLAVLERKAINDFLLEHIVPGYLLEEDFEDGFNLLSLTNTALPIKISKGDVFIGPAKVDKPQLYVYNLGAIFIIDKPFQDIAVSEPLSLFPGNMGDDVAVISLENSPSTGIKEELNLLPAGDMGAAESLLSSEGVLANKLPTVTVTDKPGISYEVRTEISFSRQINNGEIVPVSRDVIERAKSFRNQKA